MIYKRKYRVGDWVEVRRANEILKTLDKNARLDGMPFMPQMFSYCGKRFQIHKRAHKTCDTVFPIRSRRVINAVHLDLRCDGEAYGGCEARCRLFWKTEWLKAVPGPVDRAVGSDDAAERPGDEGESGNDSNRSCTMSDVLAGTRVPDGNAAGEPVYVCQATQLPSATLALNWWNVGQYVEDYTSGNTSLWQMICGGTFSAYYNLSMAGIGLGRPMRWFYNKFHRIWGGSTFPWDRGTIPVGAETPAKSLSLQPDELVQVKSHADILKTINVNRQNRGLYFDADMVPYCGGRFRVMARVTKILDEKTGKMNRFRNPAIILDGAYCRSRYAYCRMFCPRGIFAYWREIWLERVGADTKNRNG